MKYRLEGIPASLAPLLWNVSKPFIDKMIPYSHGDIVEDELYLDLVNAKNQLWHIVDENDTCVGIWITELTILANGDKVLQWYGCAGHDMKEWIDLRFQIEKWAAKQGAKAAYVKGRKGWEKVLPDYKAVFVGYTKDLDYERQPEEIEAGAHEAADEPVGAEPGLPAQHNGRSPAALR